MFGVIISHVCGGLGNQMFQYAAGRALSLRWGCPLRMDTTWYAAQHPEDTFRTFQLPVFPNLLEAVQGIDTSPPSRLRLALERRGHRLPRPFSRLFPVEIHEPHYHYWAEMADVRPPARLYGYWQCEHYFRNYAEQIRFDFAFPQLPAGAADDMAQCIVDSPNATAVHIRRGDYVSNAKAHAFHGYLGTDYYRYAIEFIRAKVGKNVTLFFFSDDPQWVRENFDSYGHNDQVVALNLPAHHDMHLMALCRHHVLANSSFSWWGAWLAAPGGVTVAPRRWFAVPEINTNDICPATWEQL